MLLELDRYMEYALVISPAHNKLRFFDIFISSSLPSPGMFQVLMIKRVYTVRPGYQIKGKPILSLDTDTSR